jgi:hypothetical protein
MADAKIMTFGELFSPTIDVIPDNKAAAVEIEGLDGKDYIKIDTTDGSEAVKLVSSGMDGGVVIGTAALLKTAPNSGKPMKALQISTPATGAEPFNEAMVRFTQADRGEGQDDGAWIGLTHQNTFSIGSESPIYISTRTAGTAILIENDATTAFYKEADFRDGLIVSDGDVGIGTTDPQNKLHVAAADSGEALIRFTNSTTNHTSGDGSYIGIDANETLVLWQKEAGSIYIGTSDTTRMFIASDGGIHLRDAGTVKSVTNILEIENRQYAADMDGTGSAIHFKQYAFDPSTPSPSHVPDDSGKIMVVTETDWKTDDAATRDSYMAFQTSDGGTLGTRMRISSAGDVTITGAAAPVLEIRDSRDNPGATDLGAISFTSSDASAGDDYCATIVCESINGTAKPDGALRFTMFENGTANGVVRMENNGDVDNTTGTYGTISDERIKENITDAPSQWDDLKSIQFRKYNLINNDKTMIGCVAQELESVCPGLVSTAEGIRESQGVDIEGLKSVKQSILFMKGMKALQEALLRIEVLESRLNEGN